ncbi:DarT ssDNA thymidine ADP-ribosyltransferase family protein [Amnibacterium endophyticum]|uniref:DarT ssDNA thymidine ADP-ribosyltransferase family protein n=1 Tax=Amnibacterium endophyticum TaxID=2109337 RepID=A0ABW4LCF1_9MICO
MTECIHGFDEGMCDICFPRVAPQPVSALASPPSRPASRASATATRPKRVAPPAGRPATVPPFGARRLYHWTHLTNLESILLDGDLRSRASGVEPDVDVAAPLVRDLRARADVGDGRTVTDFVPFAASPDSDRWAEVRTGAEGAQWSAAARATSATDYALLVVTGKELGADVVVADGDASAPLTAFTIGEPAKAVARLTRTDPDLVAAEVLVPGPVPLSAVSLIAVANEPARARVRGMFRDVEGAAPRVVVHPPWFVPAS